MLGGHGSFLLWGWGGGDCSRFADRNVTEIKRERHGKVGHIDIVCYFNWYIPAVSLSKLMLMIFLLQLNKNTVLVKH